MQIKNLAFIDGQNLHMGSISNHWKVNHNRFRVYLKEKYKIGGAYYFMGYFSKDEQKLYENLQIAGFILIFKQHNSSAVSHKKGNVDVDIVFHIMQKIVDKYDFNKIVLVSSDGDYKILVDYLIKNNKFEKILFPTKRSSSLYKKLGAEYFDYIDNLREYIEHK